MFHFCHQFPKYFIISFSINFPTKTKGHAIAQAVSRWLPSVAAGV
jgi:hypothetical protein